MQRFTEIRLMPGDKFEGKEATIIGGKPFMNNFKAGFPLFLIREAVEQGCSMEDLADGFGPGEGTHGDWSAIRDSSLAATNRMLERALNFLFGDKNKKT